MSKENNAEKQHPKANGAEVNSTNGILGWIERMGNKLPHPFWLFVWICIIVIFVSAVTAWIGVRATDPGSGEVIHAQNLMSGEGLRMFVENMVSNFAYFAPFGLVLVMLMGVSIAERSGLMAVVMRTIAFSVPKKIVLPVIFIIGACGNIGSDAGIVIVPPIAAIIFAQMGLSPIAGLIAGYAGATAGFTANFFIAGTDVLLAGISTEVTQRIDPNLEVSATANWYFMIASTLMVGFGGAFIAKRFTIPRARLFEIDSQAMEVTENLSLTDMERRGLKRAGVAFLLYASVIALLVIPEWGPLRDPYTGGIVPSPFLRGLVPILFFMFAIPGYVYGKATGVIKKANDAMKQMEHGMKELSGYIVLMLVVSQFINLFAWSNLDSILSIYGAKALQATGFTGPLMIAMFVIFVAGLNIFIGSGSAKWAILAPVFIPMLYQVGYSPAFVQLIYRIGDSITNVVSPLYVYFPLLLGWIHKYNKNIGIGTVISMLLPYAVILLIFWLILLFVWFFLDLPIGVGEVIHLR